MADFEHINESRDTQQRILIAALQVFAQRGFDAATLKEITDRADANIASVNYYFRSKDELIRHVLETFIGQMNRKRMEALDQCMAAGPLELESLIHAVVAPVVYIDSQLTGGRALVRLILQLRAVPRPAFSKILVEQFDPVHERFIDAFQGVLPELSRQDVILRYNFARGATMQILNDIDPDVQRLATLGLKYGPDFMTDEMIVMQLVNFVKAGFLAPPVQS